MHQGRFGVKNNNFVSLDLLSLFLIISFIAVFIEASPGSNFDLRDIWNKHGDDDVNLDFEKDRDTMEEIVNIIVGIVVFFFVAIIAFIMCLCCPICMLAKMRGRRRGVVYRSTTTAANGTTVTTERGRGGTTIVITNPPRTAATPSVQTTTNTAPPSVIAISNNPHQQNKPYPVQESVTVVPVISAQQHAYHAIGYPQQEQPQVPYQLQPHCNQGPMDLPPPYPGFTREIDNNSNLPFNPYYSEGIQQASAPPAKE